MNPILFCYKTTCFRHPLCPSSGVFYCTFGTGKFHAMTTLKQSQDGSSSILTLCGSGHQKPTWNLSVPNVQ